MPERALDIAERAAFPPGESLAASAHHQATELHRAGAPIAPPGDIGHRAAQQVAAAFLANPEGQIEIRLDLEELGPVRLALTPADGGVTVQISADRGETLDLLRRHAETLARELREAGYGQVSFRFGSDTPPQGGSSARHGYASQAAVADEASVQHEAARQADLRPPRSTAGGSLDIRL